MKFENILWDWNGTLLNDIQCCVDIANKMLKDHGKAAMSVPHYQSIFSFPVKDYYVKAGFDFEKASFETLSNTFIGQYNSAVLSCQLHQAAKPTLSAISARGCQQFILTAAKQDSVVQLLDDFEIADHFSAVAGLDNIHAASKVQRGKELLKNFNIKPQKTVIIGDTIHDYEVAEHLGVHFVLVSSGHQSHERLVAAVGEDNVIDQLEKLGAWLAK